MPEKETLKRAHKDERQGKSASTQAGEFVREEFHHVREGKHGARSPQQAIAIGLSKARRAGVKLPPPARGQSSRVRRQARRDYDRGQRGNHVVSRKRSQITFHILQHEGRMAGSRSAISQQAQRAARRRSLTNRLAAAQKAVRTKGHARLSAAARKAARTRAARR